MPLTSVQYNKNLKIILIIYNCMNYVLSTYSVRLKTKKKILFTMFSFKFKKYIFNNLYNYTLLI